jgi:hypothetical protein
MVDKLTPKQSLLGREVARKLIDVLDLPKNTVGFSLRVYAGQFVTIECEYVLDDGRVAPLLAEHDVTPQP